MEKTENYLRILMVMFFANTRLVFICMAFFSIISILIVFLAPPIYHVTGTVIVKSKKINAPAESARQRISLRSVIPATIEDVRLETRVLSNPELIKTAITQLIEKGVSFDYLSGGWFAFKNKYLRFLFKSGEDEVPLSIIDLATMDVYEKLQTIIIPGSNLISVEMNCNDPVLGAKVLNAIFENYLKFRLHIFTDPSALDLFAVQAKNYKVALEGLERKKLSILKKYGISDVENELSNQLNLIGNLKKELLQMENALLKRQREIEYLENLVDEYISNSSNMYQPFPHDFSDEKIKSFGEQLDTLLFKYYKSLKVYQEDTPKIKLMQDQIRELWKKMTYLVQTNIQRRRDQVGTLELSIANKKSNIERLIARTQVIVEGKFKLDQVETEIALNRDNYEAFIGKYEEARIEQTSEVTQKSNVQILNRASVPGLPIFPKKAMILAIGLITGFVLGFSLALIKEFFDHTFKAPWQVQKYLNLPVIGTVPYQPD